MYCTCTYLSGVATTVYNYYRRFVNNVATKTDLFAEHRYVSCCLHVYSLSLLLIYVCTPSYFYVLKYGVLDIKYYYCVISTYSCGLSIMRSRLAVHTVA